MRKRTFIISAGSLLLLLFLSFLLPELMEKGDAGIDLLSNRFFQGFLFIVRTLLWFGLAFLVISRQSVVRLAGKLSLTVLLIGGLLVFCELFARAIIPQNDSWARQFPVDNTRVPYPYIEFKGDSVKYNELGYPGPSPNYLKDAGEYRIFMLGGSTVFNGDPPISVLMKEEFSELGLQQVKVFNFGVVSSSSPMELARVLYEIVDYSPDLVLFYNGANDMSHPLHWDPRPGYPFNFVAYENNVLLKEIEAYPGFLLFAYNSYLLRLLFKKTFSNEFGNLDHLRQQEGYLSEAWEKGIADAYVQALVKTHRLGQAFGFEFITFFQPMIHYKQVVHPTEKQFISEFDTPHHRRLRQLILTDIDSLAISFPFVDASDLFGADSDQHFTDDVHILQTSKPVVAKYLVNELLKRYDFSNTRLRKE